MRVILIVLDSVGVGALPDAKVYGDEGSDTLGNTARAVGPLELPNLASLGLGNLVAGLVPGVPALTPQGACGRLALKSPGKDTTTGHWEMCGVILDRPFPTYPDGFRPEVIKRFEAITGRQVLGNRVASGTEIIKELGEEHMQTGRPIVYTSADSVFQVAAHEDIVDLKTLYEWCAAAREILVGDDLVSRVIARPFTGSPGNFVRTANRKDFAVPPVRPTLLDYARKSGVLVTAIGKIHDIFAGRGIDESIHTANNKEGIEAILRVMGRAAAPGTRAGTGLRAETGLRAGADPRHGTGARDGTGSGDEASEIVFANLVDFDMLYGHRNDALGFARALEEFDRALPCIFDLLREDDTLIITADHGCDPTTPSTDHSREYVPFLMCGNRVRQGVVLADRESLADLGATVAKIMGIRYESEGVSFAHEVWEGGRSNG